MEILFLFFLIVGLSLLVFFWIHKKSKNSKISERKDSEDSIRQLIADKARLESSEKEKSKQIEEYKKTQEKLHSNLEQAHATITELKLEKREQKTQIEAEKEKIYELKDQFEKQKAELKNEFTVLSEKIIKERQKALNEQNKENVGALLKPLQEEIQTFRKRVNEVHTETVKGNSALESEIKKVMEVGLKLGEEAGRLTSALKGDSQSRGAWGEAQLERTLQISGLVEGDHYEKRSPFKDELGKQKQTDYLIKLPDNKHIIIDSKVSLVSYDRAIALQNESERKEAMDEYVRSVKRHIEDLAGKEYLNLSGIESPNFVLMFMPIEPAYIEALKHDKSLFLYGYNKNIILLSHTTLIPILRTIANLWIMDKSYKEAGKISEQAGDIYNSVCSVFQRFQKLGHTLNTAANHYNEVVTALAGRQGLEGKVDRFKKISNKANKEMPQLESRYFQFETAKLRASKKDTVKKLK